MKNYLKTLNYSIDRKKKLIDEKVQFFNEIHLFNWVEISPIDACNRKCEFCPKSDPKIAPDTYNKMPLALIEKFNSELKEINFNGTIVFAGYGEPLLLKNIYDMIKILSSTCNVEVTTNGDPLKPSIIKKLLESNIGKIVVSMYDGPEQVNFFNKMFEEAKCPKDKYVLRDRWYKEDEGFGLMLTNRAGVLEFENKNLPKNHDMKCFYSHYSMMIDWNGDVYLCTQDWNRKVSPGNIGKTNILEIWNSKFMKNFRSNLECGKRLDDPCKNCNANGTMHGETHAIAWKKYYG